MQDRALKIGKNELTNKFQVISNNIKDQDIKRFKNISLTRKLMSRSMNPGFGLLNRRSREVSREHSMESMSLSDEQENIDKAIKREQLERIDVQ